jgi:hypothetical protein
MEERKYDIRLTGRQIDTLVLALLAYRRTIGGDCAELEQDKRGEIATIRNLLLAIHGE